MPAAYADYAAFTTAGGSASDNCSIDAGSFVLLSEVSDNNSCPETLTRTYQISDVNGNSISCTQDIVVDDVTNPTASNPLPVNVECIGRSQASGVRVVSGAGGESSV